MYKKESDNTIRICCGKKGCPTVTDLGNGKVLIKDDDGKEVIMTAEEAKALSQGVHILESGDDKQLLLEKNA
jgi:hypothetical protein